MIIGENFNNEYYTYSGDNYDYHFRRQSKSARQQMKSQSGGKRRGNQKRRGGRKAGELLKMLPIVGNFGLFNKDKQRELDAINAANNDAALPSEDINTVLPEPPTATPSRPSEEDPSTPGADGVTTPSEGSPSDALESEYDEFDTDSDTKKKDVGKTKSKGGMSPAVGFTCVVLTVAILGYALYHLDKKSKEEILHAIKGK